MTLLGDATPPTLPERRRRHGHLRYFSGLAGYFRKAIAAGWAAGGGTALGSWQLTGVVSGAALRGVVVGIVTGLIVAYIPNDSKPPKKPEPDRAAG